MSHINRRWQALALAGLAGVALIGAACGGPSGDNDDDAGVRDSRTNAASQAESETSGRAPSGAAALKDGAPYTTAAATAAAPTGGSTGGGTSAGAASALDRKIIFSATIALGVENLDASFNAVGGIAKTYGGFIERSTFQGATGSGDLTRTATVTLRVPAETYHDALQSIRTLPGAKVNSESAKSTEVTEQYTDLQSRLRNLPPRPPKGGGCPIGLACG